jgi:hypothetical protein
VVCAEICMQDLGHFEDCIYTSSVETPYWSVTSSDRGDDDTHPIENPIRLIKATELATNMTRTS